MISFIKKYYIEILLFILIATLILFKLGMYGLRDWDEAIYAAISRNVLSGHIFTLDWRPHQHWFEKPPLFFWFTAIFYKFLGVSEFSARLPSAVSGISLSFVMYFFAKKLFDRETGLVVLLTIVLNSLLLFQSRFGTIDVFALLLTTISCFFFWLSQEKKSYLLYSFIALGFASLAKGPVVLPELLFFLIYSISTKQFFSFLKSKYFWFGLVCFFAVMLPWHLYMLEKFGAGFYNTYFLYHILKRAREPIEGHTGTIFTYPLVIFKAFPLLLSVFLLPFIAGVKKFLCRKEILFLALWFTIQYLAISSVATKLNWYILPVFVPLQIFIAAVLVVSFKQFSRVGKIVMSFLIIALLIFSVLQLPKSFFHKRVNDDRDCLIAYTKLQLNKKYIQFGYFEPTVRFYLNSDAIVGFPKLTDAPKNTIILVKNGYKLTGQYEEILHLDGCDFVIMK